MSSASREDEVVLYMSWPSGIAHSVVPYRLEDQGDGSWYVWVYDPNQPGDLQPYVEINEEGLLPGSFTYHDHRLPASKVGISCWPWTRVATCSISGYRETQDCPDFPPFGSARLALAADSRIIEVLLNGAGHLLISDSVGRRVGYADGQVMNEIPAAEVLLVPGGLVPVEPIYYLPFTDTYTILLDGQTLTQTERAVITQFGPGYALSVEEIPLEPNAQDHLSFASDGTHITFSPGNSKEVNLTLAHDSADYSDGFYVKGMDVSAGQAVTLTNDVTAGRLAFANAQSTGSYNLEIARINTTWGERTFTHTNVGVAASDTQYLQYGSWDGSGPMTLSVDHGSDGTVDETVTLENQRVQALAGGWNLLSLTLAPTSTAITQALASIAGHYDQVYAYDATDAADPWKLYDVARPSFLNDLAQVNERMGLWVHTSAPLTLTVSGRAPFSTTIPLVEGWNLVGYPGLVTRPITEALASIAGKYNLVQTYDAAESRWLTYDVSMPPFLNDLTEMVPGKGYWLVVTEDCVWNVE
jgi:hypothetical protein